MVSQPAIENLTSVTAALLWLLELDGAVSKDQILHEARQRGLIDSDVGANWKADGLILDKMLRAALRRPLPSSEEMGAILHGLGEMGARSHARIVAPVQAFLRRHKRSFDFSVLLDTAEALDNQFRRPLKVDTLAFAQWIGGSTVSWTDFEAAANRIERPWSDAGGAFGFGFVAQTMIRSDLTAVDHWVAAHSQSQALATLGRAISQAVMKPGAALPLLKSRIAAFRLIAAAALVAPVFTPKLPVKVRDVIATLTANDFAHGDAIWIAGRLIKEALHSRYRLIDTLEKSEARLKYLRRNPEKVSGGRHNVDSEQRWLERRLTDLNAQYTGLLPTLEQMLIELAELWPDAGLSDQQLAQLENIFVGTPEIRFRLAEKLQHLGNRDWFLKANWQA